ncbi:MAG TPA: hypothetical protein VK909_07270 [Anaerolineales bacterium]|nr:hypothetical protein [Anaerolineales bacterium]
MTLFGNALRSLRNASNDPDRLNKRLTQERLGSLLGEELDDLGFTAAAVSEWELGKSKINADDRSVLMGLLAIFHRCGSLKTIAEANQFLECGNYRALNQDEVQKIFGTLPDEFDSQSGVPEEKRTRTSKHSGFADIFSISQDELNELFAKAKEGPEPAWPRILAGLMRKASDRFSLSISTVLWFVVWLSTVWLIGPSLRLPFDSHDRAFVALCLYASSSLIVPLFVGILVTTKDNEYWKQQSGVRPFLLRLYTYQGAGIGFNVGYFLVFALSLILYYLGFQPAVWLEIFGASVSLILSHMAARVVPHNLWLAYKRLALRDGGIFFVVALMGPFWGLFFLEYYSLLLAPVTGWIIILLALIGVRWIARKLKRQTLSTHSTI